MYLFLLGRILFSSLFILKAIHHFSGSALSHAVDKDVCMPHVLVPVSGLVMLLGGLSILFGYRAKIGAWALLIMLLPMTVCMHSYWSDTDSFAAMMNQYCFLKNISLIGALLMLTHFGSGPMSLRK